MFLSCLLYTDDILLLSIYTRPSVKLHIMCRCRLMSVNVDTRLLVKCLMLFYSNLQIERSDCIKYLGVYVVNCKHVKFDINLIKRSFYAACNSIFSHSHGTSELAILIL